MCAVLPFTVSGHLCLYINPGSLHFALQNLGTWVRFLAICKSYQWSPNLLWAKNQPPLQTRKFQGNFILKLSSFFPSNKYWIRWSEVWNTVPTRDWKLHALQSQISLLSLDKELNFPESSKKIGRRWGMNGPLPPPGWHTCLLPPQTFLAPDSVGRWGRFWGGSEGKGT